jgi:hypothetical protein
MHPGGGTLGTQLGRMTTLSLSPGCNSGVGHGVGMRCGSGGVLGRCRGGCGCGCGCRWGGGGTTTGMSSSSSLSVPIALVAIGLGRRGGGFAFGRACVRSRSASPPFAFARARGFPLVPVGQWRWGGGLPPLLLLLLSLLSSPLFLLYTLSPHFLPLIPLLLFLPIHLLPGCPRAGWGTAIWLLVVAVRGGGGGDGTRRGVTR